MNTDDRIQELEQALKGLVRDIDDLMGSSAGVVGLHMNGDIAALDEFQQTGDPWLGASLHIARCALEKE